MVRVCCTSDYCSCAVSEAAWGLGGHVNIRGHRWSIFLSSCRVRVAKTGNRVVFMG